MQSREYKQLLPLNTNRTVIDQFGWLPMSVIRPESQVNEKWDAEGAYLDVEETRRSEDAEYLPNLGFSEFHAHLAEIIVNYWSLPGAKVVDPFMGRATRAVVTTKLGRYYQGYEVSPKTYYKVTKRCEELGLDTQLELMDGTRLANTPDNYADLVFTCPPYWNIEKYEDVEHQLSSRKSYDHFMRDIGRATGNIARVMKPGTFCCWVCADFRTSEGFHTFHIDTIEEFRKSPRIKLHDIVIIENISPFAPLQAGKVAAKRYASKVHEYLLVFRKEGDYEIPSYCKTENEIKLHEQFFG